MKINLKKDFWGIIFATGIGVVSFMTYKIGKTEGAGEAYSEINDFLVSALKDVKTENINQ